MYVKQRKICIFGNTNVGKSSIVKTYILDINLPTPRIHNLSTMGPTIGAAFNSIQIDHVKLQIWDTAGGEQFRTICPIYYRGSYGCICVFDVTDRASFDSVDNWIRSFCDYVNESDANNRILLLANKIDRPTSEWKVSIDEIKDKADNIDCEFMLTSTVNMVNFDNFRKYIKTTYVNNQYQNNKEIEKDSVILSSDDDHCMSSCF